MSLQPCTENLEYINSSRKGQARVNLQEAQINTFVELQWQTMSEESELPSLPGSDRKWELPSDIPLTAAQKQIGMALQETYFFPAEYCDEVFRVYIVKPDWAERITPKVAVFLERRAELLRMNPDWKGVCGAMLQSWFGKSPAHKEEIAFNCLYQHMKGDYRNFYGEDWRDVQWRRFLAAKKRRKEERGDELVAMNHGLKVEEALAIIGVSDEPSLGFEDIQDMVKQEWIFPTENLTTSAKVIHDALRDWWLDYNYRECSLIMLMYKDKPEWADRTAPLVSSLIELGQAPVEFSRFSKSYNLQKQQRRVDLFTLKVMDTVEDDFYNFYGEYLAVIRQEKYDAKRYGDSRNELYKERDRIIEKYGGMKLPDAPVSQISDEESANELVQAEEGPPAVVVEKLSGEDDYGVEPRSESSQESEPSIN